MCPARWKGSSSKSSSIFLQRNSLILLLIKNNLFYSQVVSVYYFWECLLESTLAPPNFGHWPQAFNKSSSCLPLELHAEHMTRNVKKKIPFGPPIGHHENSAASCYVKRVTSKLVSHITSPSQSVIFLACFSGHFPPFSAWKIRPHKKVEKNKQNRTAQCIRASRQMVCEHIDICPKVDRLGESSTPKSGKQMNTSGHVGSALQHRIHLLKLALKMKYSTTVSLNGPHDLCIKDILHRPCCSFLRLVAMFVKLFAMPWK